MPSRTVAGSLGLNADWNLGEDGWKDGMDANLLKLSVLGKAVAKDLVAATPGSPTEGDVYLFDETHPTHANNIAVYDEGAWVYYTPVDGWMCYDKAAEVQRQFDGTEWAEFTSGGSGGGGGSVPFQGALTYNTATQSIPATTYTTLVISNAVYNLGSFWNPANPNRFTVPAGVNKVRITGRMATANATGQTLLTVWKNGVDTAAVPGFPTSESETSGGEYVSFVTSVIEVSTGDYFELKGYVDGGSKTTVANSVSFGIEAVEAIHTVPGGLVKLADFTVGVETNVIDFQDIAQNFDDIVVVLVGRSTTAGTGGEQVFIRFNGDSGANYHNQRGLANAGTAGAVQNNSATGAYFSEIPKAGTIATVPGMGEAMISGYTKTAFQKAALTHYGMLVGSSIANQLYDITGYSLWSNTSAINRVTLSVANNNFAVGTRAIIYGRGGPVAGVSPLKPWYWKPPLSSQFTLVSGDATQGTLNDDSDVGMTFSFGALTGTSTTRGALRALTTPANDWSLTVRAVTLGSQANYSTQGIWVRDSVSGRHYVFGPYQGGFGVTYYTATNTYSAMVFDGVGTNLTTVKWYRVRHTGGNYIFEVSPNGKVWLTVLTVGDTTHLTNRANQVGLAINIQRTGGLPAAISTDSFDLTGPAV